MDDDDLPLAAIARLRERVHSILQLDILMLLHRDPDHPWSAETVEQKLHLAPGAAAAPLDHLCRGNLLDVRVGRDALLFQYCPGTPELHAAVTSVARAYGEHPDATASALFGENR